MGLLEYFPRELQGHPLPRIELSGLGARESEAHRVQTLQPSVRQEASTGRQFASWNGAPAGRGRGLEGIYPRPQEPREVALQADKAR